MASGRPLTPSPTPERCRLFRGGSRIFPDPHSDTMQISTWTGEFGWHFVCLQQAPMTPAARNTARDLAHANELGDVMRRIHGEYREMPGLRLTAAQAQRLWNLDRDQCTAVLDALIEARLLHRTDDGAFILS